MNTLIHFIARTSTILYVLAVIGIILAFRSFLQAQGARRIAVFGLEREAAEEKQRRAFSSMVLLFLLIGAVYIITNIVVPNLDTGIAEPTPTPIVFVTQQPTPTESRVLYPTVTPT